MQQSVQEFYTKNILPLDEHVRAKLAELIIGDLSNRGQTTGLEESHLRTKSSIRNLFGKGRSGDSRGGDNERIDADLTREYGSKHEDAY